jgi:glutaredoxin
LKVQIYGKPACPKCDMAKRLCESRGLEVDYKEVGADITKEQLEEKIGFSIRSVPQIFVTADGFSEYVGGFEQLVIKLKNE